MGTVTLVLFLVVAPIAPTAALGATATDGPAATEPPATAAMDSTTDRPVRFAGEPRPEKLSGGLQFQLRDASATERVPVLVVFDRQPDEALALDRLGNAAARQRMRALAEDTQSNVLSYLDRQAERGRATDVQSFWIRNVVAVEAHPAVIEELTKSSQVDRVVYDSPVRRTDGEYTGSAGAFLGGLEAYGNLSMGPSGFERETSGTRAWGVEYVGADDVQEAGVTGEGVNVSVVDTGIDESHPAIPEVTRWRDFVNNSSTPVDPHGHGTHVAGTVAGQPDAKRAVGVAPGANLFGARVLDANGAGRSSDVIAGFQWSANNSADVVSASLGQSPILDTRRAELAVSNASSRNASFDVFATGNGTTNDSSSYGYRPAFVLVQVEPVSYNGSSLTAGSAAQASVEENLSLTLRDPTGARALTAHEAGFMFQSGEVPVGIEVLKYEPSTVREIQNGTWSLTVENANAENVSVDVTTAPVYPPNGTDEVSRVADNLAAQGVVPVISAGNSGTLFGNQSVGSPGAAERAITVGATGAETNDVAPFSSRGPVGFESPRPGVDLLAPGTAIVSAGSTEAYVGEEPYVTASGTSMAAPHVSGTVALLLSVNPGMSVSTVETTLRDTAQPVPGGQNAVGAGALDTWVAVNSTTDLGTPATERGVRDLWAGIGNSGERYVSVEPEPPADPVGDAADAPDLEAVYVDSRYDLEFQFGFADETSPNATVVVYLDVDENRTTGAASTDPPGAEYRFDVTRTYFASNDTYDLAVSPYAYNGSASRFEPSNVYTYDARADGDYVGFDVNDNDLAGIDDDRFDWYVVSRNASTGTTDRVPDTGALDTEYTANVSGIAVTWNATAGGPAVDVPVGFRLFDENSGAEVGNATVRTNASGLATTELTVEVAGGFGDFTLEVTDDRNNRITQSYDVYAEDLADQYVADEGGSLPYEVGSKSYLAAPNATVSLNVPIYRIDNGSYETYSGPASIRLRNYDAPNENDTAYVDGLTVSDGVLRTTVDFATLALDDYGGEYANVDVEVALESDFRNRTGGSEYAGDVDLTTERYETALGPDGTVVAPGSAANLTFQHVLASTEYSSERQTAANVTAVYNVTWVTDRYVASVYRDLPSSVATAVRQARDSGERLGPTEYRELREAVRNVSADGTAVEYVSGQAIPAMRGIGDLQVTPPSDARFGIVEAQVDPSVADGVSVSPGRSTVFVDGRLSPYVREPTAPAEDDRYDLRIRAHWDEHREGEYVVPNETVEVDVSLYDSEADTLVDGATVSLYSTSGATTTVTTNGSREVTTEIAVPDLDYRNVSDFDFEEQQVVGIVQGYNGADGGAVADEDYVYASSHRVGSGDQAVRPVPDLSWSNGTLNLTVEYRNASWDPVEGTETLVQIGTPDLFDSRRDVFVGFVNGTNTTVLERTFDEPVPSDAAREYEVGAQTPSVGLDTYWVDGVGVGGPQVTLVSPDELRPNVTQNVTLEVTTRDGRPIEGAAVRFSWVDVESIETPGESFFGTTDASGRVTFPVTPTAPDSDPDGRIDDAVYEVGIATANYSSAVYDRGSVPVNRDTDANVTGQLTLANGSAAADDFVVAFPRSGSFATTLTDAAGNYELTLQRDATYSVGYYQGDGSSASNETGGWDPDDFARDGNVDMYGLANVTPAGDTSLGSEQLPGGHVVDVVVENATGSPVRNASVSLYHWNASHGDASRGRAGWVQLTAGDGRIYPNAVDSGMELTGNVTVRVEPPENSTEFVDETPVRNLTVAGQTNVTVRLEELGEGDLVVAPDDVDANVTTTRFALENTTHATTPSEYRWTFGDGTTVNTTVDNTTHVYTRAGEYDATVEALDANGSVLVSARTTVTVTQAGDANLTATPETADVNVTNVTFDLVDPSVDPNVTVANYTYSFGDGDAVTTDASTTAVSHTYGRLAGEVTARVVATNTSETTLFTDVVNVTVTDRVSPVVRLDAPTSVPQNAEFVVNASTSSDNHRIANYTFETDTGLSNTTTSPSLSLNVSEPGNHTVTVTVTDALGNTNRTQVTVEVLARPDLAVDVSAAETQRLQDGVGATVNVTNVGGNDVDGSFDVVVEATDGNVSTRQTYTVASLASGGSDTRTVDLTAWAQSATVTGEVSVNASVAPVPDEASTDDNTDETRTLVTYSDVRVRLAVPTEVPAGENVTAYALFQNAGTAASDATTATLAVNGTAEQLSVPALQPGEVARSSTTEAVSSNRTYELAVDDPLFPAGNASTADLRVFQYDLTARGISAPAEVEQGDVFLVVGEFDVNAPGEVNASLSVPAEMGVQGAATKAVYAQSGTNTVRWRVSVPADATQQNVTLSATLSRLGETGRLSAETEVVVPKLRLANETSVVVDDDNASNTAGYADLTNATTYDHELVVDVQAGARGRALKGLEYLFNYPYGCVEQTTSPMLAALNTDQYYRDRPNASYDRGRVNESIAQGVDRLAPNGSSGANAQHDNGAWSMWGSDPSGDLFYTVYALYGTTAVQNDDVQGPANAGQLGELDYDSTVDWLAAHQDGDGSFRSNHYYEDRRSMTGLALVAADRADDAGASGTKANLTRLRENATEYLLAQQNADGSWNGDDDDASPMATALAARGLATVVDDQSLSASLRQNASDALNASVSYLERTQNADGSWDGYHDARSWDAQGDTSEATAQALLALDTANATGAAVDDATVERGAAYLTGVYRADGSFGYTRATAVAIDALQRLSGSGVDRTVTVELVDSASGQVLLDRTVTVTGEDPVGTIELTDDANATTLQTLREAGRLEVRVTSTGSGTAIVGVSSDQVVDEREYLTEAN